MNGRVDNVETIEQEQDLSVDKSGGISTENDSVSIEEQTQESNATAITEDRSLTFCEDKFGRISTENDSVRSMKEDNTILVV